MLEMRNNHTQMFIEYHCLGILRKNDKRSRYILTIYIQDVFFVLLYIPY